LDKKLLAGEFKFQPNSSINKVALVISSGLTVKRRLTIAEGLTGNQIKNIIFSAPGLIGEVPNAFWREGTLLPETYFYSYGNTRLSIVNRMRENLDQELKKAWLTRPENSPLKSSAEAMVLASIIEKETAINTERSIISGVFHNRLRSGMRLQSDPTVVYSITMGRRPLKRALLKKDLSFDSPFNTYVHKGLPPNPICNPGVASIKAAIMPARTPYFYFVADGLGGHAFASTLKEHIRNVVNWRKKKRRAN
tara:strand:- start:237 stop:989 length:753 start_codon:yes stop_codon:yes gene_type:complete